jgi:prepilin-type N-terminal cleavage/methylation domain-containing protein
MIARKKQQGFTLVEIMIVVSIIILLAAIAVPSFIRARQRTQGSTTLNGARQLDAAVDQWAIENGINNGATVTLASLAVYIKPGQMQTALSGGTAPTDALGNAYVFSLVGSGQVQVSSATKTALSGVINWGPY